MSKEATIGRRSGPFYLIDQVEEDALGKVYCANWHDTQGSDEIVLARYFDRRGLDLEACLQEVVERWIQVKALDSPYVAPSLHLTLIDGHAVSAVNCLAGRTLGTWLDRAVQSWRPVPLKIALLVVGRLASALKVAGQESTDGKRLLHGFVTPQMVLLNAHGEVRLAGLEIAPALRDFRGTATAYQKILPFLSPELREGEEPHAADDVYSLGVLLYQMLTLKSLASDRDLTSESLRLAGIREELRYFLNRSIAPRFRRMQSVAEWLQELKALVVSADLTASSEKLAAFLAGLEQKPQQAETDTVELSVSQVDSAVVRVPANRAEDPMLEIAGSLALTETQEISSELLAKAG